MSPAAGFHAQLASIMEVLANTAVAEICELVDSSYSVLQLEISRSRKENEVLRRKLRLLELRAARATALRAAALASGSAALRAHQPPVPRTEPRRNETSRGQAAPSLASSQETPRCDSSPSSDSGPDPTHGTPAGGESTKLTAEVIKVEDDDDDDDGDEEEKDSWTRTEPDDEFCHIIDGQTIDAEAPPLQNKQEVDEVNDLTCTWVSEASSTSLSVQKTLSAVHLSDGGGYDRLPFDPQLQHGAATQNPLDQDPSCSYALNTGVSIPDVSDSGCGVFPFAVCEGTPSTAENPRPAGFHKNQQRALLAEDKPQLPVRKEVSNRQNSSMGKDRWRHPDGVSGASSHAQGDGGGRTFVCNCCGKTLACLKNLKTHMRVHTGEKPFVCALCGKRFSDSSNLKRHQSVHTGEKRYGCVHCGKRFAQSGSLKVHMTVHTDCKQFRCSYCSKTFISGSHLRRHVTMHAGEKQHSHTLQ